MDAPSSPGPDPIRASALREYRLSVALLALGVALVVVLAFLSLWYHPNAGGDGYSATGLALEVGWTAGGMLILLAGTVAYYHRSFLAQHRRMA